MTISDCVKMALAKSKRKRLELSEYLGLSRSQTLNNKFVRDSWSGDDLVKVAEFTGGELKIVYPDGQEILILSDGDKGEKEPE